MSTGPPRPVAAPPQGPPTDLQRGFAFLDCGSYVRARRIFETGIRAGGPFAPWHCQGLVQSYLRTGDVDGPEPKLRGLLAPGSVILDFALGYLYWSTGRRRQAVEVLERAAAVKPRYWAAFIELGYLLCRGGDEARGLTMLRGAERHFRRAGDAWGESRARALRVTHLSLEFRLHEAIDLSERVIELKRQVGDRLGLGGALNTLGNMYFFLTDYRRALETHRAAAAALGTRRDHPVVGMVQNSIGLSLLDLAEPARAAQAFRRAVAVFRSLGDTVGGAGALANLGLAHLQRGDVRAAVRHYRTAYEKLGTETSPDYEAGVVACLAQALTLSGKPTEALEALDEIVGRQSEFNTRVNLQLARERAKAELALGNYKRAARSAELALEHARSMPAPQRAMSTQWLEAQSLLGQAMLAQGRQKAGLEVLRKAAAHAESQLRHQRGASIRVGLLETYRDVHDARIEGLVGTDTPGMARRAWSIACRLKARELYEVVVHPSRSSGRRRQASRRRELAIAELRQLTNKPVLTRSEVGRLRELRNRYLTEGDAEVEHPTARRRPIGDEPQPLAIGGSAILEFHVGRKQTLVFIIQAARVQVVRVQLGEHTLTRAVERLLEPLHRAGRGAEIGPALGSFDPEAGNRLYRRLVRPAIDRLPTGVKRLIVVPDRALHALPFEMLQIDEVDSEVASTCLGDRYVMSYAQSTALLSPQKTRRAPASLFAMAYSPSAATTIQAALGPIELGPLPMAASETRSVGELFERAEVVTDSDATVRAYHELAPRASLIHLAAHGLSDPIAPGLSGIVVAPPVQPSARPTDFLSADEIATTSIRADLVTLSACETARGKLRGREGVLGLSRAFFEAGASAVLASLWPIDDAAAGQLMTAFYRHLLDGADRASALWAAKRELRRPGAVPIDGHPFYWAPFVLFDHQPVSR